MSPNGNLKRNASDTMRMTRTFLEGAKEGMEYGWTVGGFSRKAQPVDFIKQQTMDKEKIS